MTYTALAPLYDKIMSHVRYDRWHQLIKNIASRHFTSSCSIFEIGGGTGTLGNLLRDDGFIYQGSDISFAMCKEAGKKGHHFICADSCYLPIKSHFDLAIFLYDGINYFSSLDQFKQFFYEVFPILNRGGALLFDITTENNSIHNFLDILDSEDYGNASYTRHSYYNQETKAQHNDFIIYAEKKTSPELQSRFVKEYENHIQRIFSLQEIVSAIPKDLFSIGGIWDNFSFEPGTDQSERVHFFLQKVAS